MTRERDGMASNENVRRIDDTIARFAARAHGADAFESALAAAESNLHIEMHGPPKNANRPVELTRRAIERAVRGYVGWIASQVAAFDGAILEAVRELGNRVRAAEENVDVLRSAVTRLERSVVTPDGLDALMETTREDPMGQAWAERALDALGHPDGRVLHAEAGTGRMVAALQAKGIDAYGVEPSYATYEVGVEEGLEIHFGGVIEHLRRVPADCTRRESFFRAASSASAYLIWSRSREAPARSSRAVDGSSSAARRLSIGAERRVPSSPTWRPVVRSIRRRGSSC